MKTIFGIVVLSLMICDAEVGGSEGMHLRLAIILKLPKQMKLHPATLDECELKEGVIRIWACSVTDNKSYMLWLQKGGAGTPKLIEFDGVGQRPLQTNRLLLPEWLSRLFEDPLDLREKNNSLGATIEHSFIIEGIKNGKYYWAFREIEQGKKSDYSKLLNLLGEASVNAIDIGWAIDN